MIDEVKKILFLTGTRADFGKLKPLMEHVKNAPGFESYIFATGMHALERYGSTYNEIINAGFENVFLYINQISSQDSAMDMVLANTIQGLGHYIREFAPDLIVVHGDRVEALAGAIVGALNNILVAHIEGGEVSGTVDEIIRHAVSKLSQLHFVANEESRRRLIQMGEVDSTIFVIGSPDIDIMLSDSLPSLDKAKKRYEIEFDRYGFLIYHPVTTELPKLRANVRAVVDAVIESQKNLIVVYPNNDSGTEIIMEEFLRLKDNPHFRIFPSIRFEYFLTLLKHASFILGNSSVGVREAPVFGVPTINLGTRQKNRNNSSLIINISDDKNLILETLSNLPQTVVPSYDFGDGGSAKRFLQILQKTGLWQISRQKQFQDVPFLPFENKR